MSVPPIIRNCPFCGATGATKTSLVVRDPYQHFAASAYVRCRKCGCRGPLVSAKVADGEDGAAARAWAAWNGGYAYIGSPADAPPIFSIPNQKEQP